MADPLDTRQPSYYQAQSPSTRTAHPESNQSSFNRPSLPPGYDRDYVPPGRQTSSSQATNVHPSQAGSPYEADSAWTTSGATGGRNGLVARAPQVTDSPSGRRRIDNEEDDYGHRASGNEEHSIDSKQPQEGFVRVRILGLDRNRRDMYIKFNAESNLPTFRSSTYRAISRSHTEFTTYVSALSVTCPQSIIPALPLPQTSAATDEEDDRILKQQYQKWVVRVMQDQAVVRDEETRSFIESDFGYTPHHKKKSTPSFPSFSRSSRGGELDDPLTLSKISMARLETTFLDSAKTVEKLSKSRRQAATAVNELGDQVNTFAMSETYAPLSSGFKRLARSIKVDADLGAVQSINELVHLGDALLYQSANARSVKETLSNRDSVSEDHRAAVKLTIQKRRNIEKLRSSTKELRSDKVDEALEELDEAKRHETLLTARLSAISSSLSPSLARHSVHTHSDLLSTLLDHAKSNLIYEKQRLKEYEILRNEMKSIRKIEGGVVYHHQQQQALGTARGSTITKSNFSPVIPPSNIQRGYPSPTSAPPMSPSASSSSATSTAAASHPPNDPLSASMPSGSRDLSSMAQKAQKRTVRSMASSVVIEGDRRQRVDSRLAASMLANGF